MIAILLLLQSLLAGCLINLIADTAPERRSLWEVLRTLDTLYPQKRMRYGGVMIAALLLGWFAYLRVGWSLAWFGLAIIAWFFLAIAVIDIEHRRILNRMVLPAIPLLLLCNGLRGEQGLYSMVLGGVVGFGIFLLLALARPGGLGMGDVKLAGVIGFVTGFPGIVAALLIGIYSGGLGALVLLVWHRRRKQTMAYGPFLAVGSWFVLFHVPELIQSYFLQ